MTTSMNTADWTWGAEHEWADFPLDRPLPEGYGYDTHDVTIVNSNGIANDPKGKLYRFGGEINTPATETIEEQVDCLRQLKALYPEAKVNYRSNLHCHVRVPGLGKDLAALKKVQAYIHANMREVLAQIEPLPRPELGNFVSGEALAAKKGALRRWRRRRVSHQTLLTPERLQKQLAATTVEEFYENEVPKAKSDRRPMWHLQPRLCVNLRQHRETDTVEFRHFPGTMDEEEFETCLNWCQDFLVAALHDRPISSLLKCYPTEKFPAFPNYVHWMEVNYRATVHDGTITKAQIEENIDKILKGETL